jgi:glc operon protein GlcG
MKQTLQLLELHTRHTTTAQDRNDTKLMGEFMLNNNRPPDFRGNEGITGFGDGVTIRGKNRVSVSALSDDKDERIAYAAMKAAYG